MGGKHSARAMQLAVKYYKDAGGTYSGKKKSGNKLKKWSDQKWDYVSKGDKKKPKSKRGRYLPKSVRESLSPSEKASTNRKKRVANARSRRKAKYSKSIARKVRNAQT